MRCMVVDCPCCNPDHLCDEHEIFYRGYCPLCYEEGQKPFTEEDE
jgi:hypothetical protein